MNNQFCVLDLETDWNKPDNPKCNPVQVAAIILDYHTLEEIPNSKFNTGVCPPTIDDDNYYDEHKDTIEWHCKLNSCSWNELREKWKSFPDEKSVWKSFEQYMNKYNSKKRFWTAPIPVGANIITFDLPIIERVNAKYGIKDMFYHRDAVNVQFLVWYHLHYLRDRPKDYKMDTLRSYFEIPNDDAHDALFDVRTTAAIFRRFFGWQRKVSNKMNFRVKIEV